MLPNGLIGVVHLAAMPGDPLYVREAGQEGIVKGALSDAVSYVDCGMDALLIENFGSAPFRKGTASQRLQPGQVALMARIAALLRERFDLPIGVNCLRNDALSALGIAAACELDFVRVNVHVGAYVTDQGIIEGEAHESLRYRQELTAESVKILADVCVKHARPLVRQDPREFTRDCIDRGLADGIVVTGTASGAAIGPEGMACIEACAAHPVFLGSGLDPENAAQLLPLVDGAIVGTFCKEEGNLRKPVDRARVERLVAAASGRFR